MKLHYWFPSVKFNNQFFLGAFLILCCIIEFHSKTSAQTLMWLNAVCGRFDYAISSNTREFTAAQQLIQLYENANWNPKKLQPEEILNSSKSELEKILRSAENVVEKLAAEAHIFNEKNRPSKDDNRYSNETVRFYGKGYDEVSATSDDLLEANNDKTLFYYNAKCRCGHQLESGNESECYTPDGFYTDPSYLGRNVSYNTSAVHIPVDVYNEGPEVLRDIVWSQNLDATFQSLFCNSSVDSSKVRWSYVATLSGVVRYYPASEWTVKCKRIDLYDGRSVHWFVQSMTSPKDVLIMIDSSGSVIGLTLSLIRVSVDHVMKSLTTNDFFNVFVFNKNATFLNPYCPGLLPALDIYKEMFMQWLDNLTVGNSSSFEKGFDFAFDVLSLQNTSRFPNSAKRRRARCNPVILLFTDGGAEYPYDAFRKWNDDKHTRVFTFSVGKHFASTASLKEMACNNKGVFTSIPSDSATHFQTMEYLVTLSKPLALHKSQYNKWTLPYEDHLNMGRVLTVSRPFFDDYILASPSKSGHHKHVTRVAGIAGADVLYRDVEKALDVKNGGATTYMFSTENNGYLIYHPLLRRGRLDSTVTVDLLDIENSDISDIRTAMIKQEKRPEEVTKLDRITLSVDKEHLSKSSYSYSYTPVSDSPFSIGLAFLDTSKYRIEPDEQGEWQDVFVDNDDVFTAAYGLDCNLINKPSSCTGDVDFEFGDVEITDRPYVIELNSADEVAANCSSLALETLMTSREFLLHGKVTQELVRNWAPSSEVLLATFVATDSKPALLRVKHYGDSDVRTKIERALSDPFHKDYFLRPLLSSSTTQFYSLIEFNDSYKTPTTPTFDTRSNMYTQAYTSPFIRPTEMKRKEFIVSEVLNVSKEDKTLRPGVTGNVVKYDWVKETLFNHTIKEVKKDDNLCVLLDDGGLLLISNQDNDEDRVGEFFGYVDADLMRTLINHSVFISNDIDDHQVVCESTGDEDSSARRSFIIPTLGSILKSGWWFTSSLWLGMQSFFTLVLTSLREVTSQVHAVPFKTDEFIFPNYNTKKHHCVVRKKVFSFGPLTSTKNITESCKRSFVAHRIGASNLIFVIADRRQSQCSVMLKEKDRYSIVTYSGTCPPERYRKEPHEKCFDASLEGSGTSNDECGACELSPSIFLILALFLLNWLPISER